MGWLVLKEVRSLNKKTARSLVGLIKEEMLPALGCTEPIAVALACARAYKEVGGDLERIEVITDRGIYKNGFSCIIPGTSAVGLEAAAALGTVAGNPQFKLEVLRDITEQDVARARRLVEKGMVSVRFNEELGIYVEARVETTNGWARTTIKETHANIIRVEANGEIRYEAEEVRRGEGKKESFDITVLKVSDIIEVVTEIPFKDISFVLEAVRMNKSLAREGLDRDVGMGVGRGMSDLIMEGEVASDIVTAAQILTAAAVDARMGGASKSAMSIAGSGSHGIVSTMPLAAVAEKKGIGEEKLARAVALSFLITLYIKAYSGRLSAFCGCAVAAGAGASAGIAFLLGGEARQIEQSIMNVASDITGIICDGGNVGCAMKAATGAGVAVMSALLSLKGIHIPRSTGIVGGVVEETIKNMGLVSSPGMTRTNEVILDVMTRKG